MFDGIKLAIIGGGKWGLNHVKTAHKLLGDNLIVVCDLSKSVEDKVKSISPNIKFCSNLENVFNNKEINAVIIATPAETHYEISKMCLINNKHILTEKPLTLLSSEATNLIEIAEKYNKKIMVGHVLLFHPAIVKLKNMIEDGFIGNIQYIYSNRLNLGTIRKEENILWSFAPHDVSIIQYLIGDKPVSVYAEGAAFLQDNIEDTTLTFLKYKNNISAHIFVSWLHPFKEQRLVVIGDKGMIVFEDSLKEDKLKFYKKGFNVLGDSIEKFESEYEVVMFDNKQALEEEQNHFYSAIINDTVPKTDGYHAKEVLEILEMAQTNLNL
ncbi:MAG: Gfo/Idh/MocA family oxidoreductase [Ignavibacteriae bacterium]|nr:Gfo/Idh/MocA family oxidoreductase [Ignavibacteriota bacterium]